MIDLWTVCERVCLCHRACAAAQKINEETGYLLYMGTSTKVGLSGWEAGAITSWAIFPAPKARIPKWESKPRYLALQGQTVRSKQTESSKGQQQKPMQDLAGFISQFMESELESNNLGFYLDLSQMLFFFFLLHIGEKTRNTQCSPGRSLIPWTANCREENSRTDITGAWPGKLCHTSMGAREMKEPSISD